MSESKHTVQSRQEYLIVKTKGEQLQNLSSDDLFSPLLKDTVVDGNVDISSLADVLKQHGEALNISLIDVIDGEQSKTLVARMSSHRAGVLKTAYKGNLLVEVDEPLEMFKGNDEPSHIRPMMMPTSQWNSGLVSEEEELQIRIVLLEEGDEHTPVSGATVYLMGSVWFDQGLTDENGRLELSLFGETVESLRGLLIKPKDTYWSRWYDNPDLSSDQENEIFLKRLGSHSSLNDFPEMEMHGWGQKAMKLDKAANFTGKNIKVAIIDSGMDTTHGDLAHQVKEGRDFTGDNLNTWNEDTVGHGSHVAGVITGLIQEVGDNKSGIRGFAPEAEIYIFKVFPGGKFSAIIKCLDRCITNKVDVVNLSLGSKNESEILHDKFKEAYNAGVACIAAAGNSKSEVMFPAAWDEVMAVAAIGKLGTFPDDSYHTRQIGEHHSGDYFTASFTCFGNEIDICAPGVAVVSSVPTGPRGYVSWDGTSMACPHVVGLAALIIEARDEIKNLHGSDRVDALFQHLKSNTEALSDIDQQFRGAGLPDAVKALGKKTNDEGEGDGTAWDSLQRILEEALEILKKEIKA